MTNPLPARAHANSSVAQREFTFDALLAEFGEFDDSMPQKRSDAAGPGEAAILRPDTPAVEPSPAVTPSPAPAPAPASAAPAFVASFELPTAEPDAAPSAAPTAVPAVVEAPRPAPQREQPAQTEQPKRKQPQPQQEQRPKRAPLRLALPSVQVLQLIGLGLLAAVSLTLAVIALSR